MKRFIEVSRRSGNRIITQRYPAREVAPASVVQRAFARLSDRRCRCGYTVCSGTGPCAPKPAEQSRPCCTDAAKGAECGCLEDYTSRWRPEPTDVFKVGDLVRALVGKDFTMATVAAGEIGEIVRETGWGGFVVLFGDDEWNFEPTWMEYAPPADVLPEGWYGGTFDDYDHVSGASVARMAMGSGELWCWWPAGAGDSDNCTDPKPTRDEAMAAALASVQPAEPALRPGWEQVTTAFPSYLHTSGGWVSSEEGDLFAARGRDTAYEHGYPTLEAAMLRAEALARGES